MARLHHLVVALCAGSAAARLGGNATGGPEVELANASEAELVAPMALGTEEPLASNETFDQTLTMSMDNMTAQALLGSSASGQSGGRCASAQVPLSSKCSGCPPMYNGKLCASTTWYTDRTKGSCGCGNSGMVDDNFWTLTQFTAALNTASLDPANPGNGYCLAGCGDCYELCTTGGTTNVNNWAGNTGRCKVFKITNRCADGWKEGWPQWCSQQMSFNACRSNPDRCRQMGNTNAFGYSAHFDLQNVHMQIQHGLGWNNVEVTFEKVSCSRWEGPKDAYCAGCR